MLAKDLSNKCVGILIISQNIQFCDLYLVTATNNCSGEIFNDYVGYRALSLILKQKYNLTLLQYIQSWSYQYSQNLKQ